MTFYYELENKKQLIITDPGTKTEKDIYTIYIMIIILLFNGKQSKIRELS